MYLDKVVLRLGQFVMNRHRLFPLASSMQPKAQFRKIAGVITRHFGGLLQLRKTALIPAKREKRIGQSFAVKRHARFCFDGAAMGLARRIDVAERVVKDSYEAVVGGRTLLISIDPLQIVFGLADL